FDYPAQERSTGARLALARDLQGQAYPTTGVSRWSLAGSKRDTDRVSGRSLSRAHRCFRETPTAHAVGI
ncbi:MAG: hypothetical protein L0338_26675, partial [Acidobacteria bacterium]|nr:hypothetical protein [Acidobacteriota bacterium]